MRLTWRDAAATLLVAAIAVPYIGYLIRGSMPFIQDPTGMAGVGLVLGAAAALVGGWAMLHAGTSLRIATVALSFATFALGTLAVVSEHLLDATWGAVVLAGFMASIGVWWALALLHHGGAVPGEAETPTGLRHA